MSETSEIRFKVELDQENIPNKLFWEATDGPVNGLQETKAFTVSIWDHQEQNSLQIGLWQKDMPVDDMKRFCIDTIGGMAERIRTATDDAYMADEMESLCDRMIDYLKQENKS